MTVGHGSGSGTSGIGLPWWTLAFPALGMVAVLANLAKLGTLGVIAAAVILIGSVLAAVHARSCWRSR